MCVPTGTGRRVTCRKGWQDVKYEEVGGVSEAGVKSKGLVGAVDADTRFGVFSDTFFEEVGFALEADGFHPFEWVPRLCDFYEKLLALGESNLEDNDRVNCKSAHTYDCILGPLADMLDAMKIFINIRNHCIRKGDELNCLNATPKETADMAKVICVIAEFVHRRKGKFILLVCGGRTLASALIPKIKKETSSASKRVTFRFFQLTAKPTTTLLVVLDVHTIRLWSQDR